ncbi:SGNH/GDSL hydrolase family protein [Saccharicrinis fermentans]|nr:SGNH/GDSL hydrolase family protein [Saccharicrinis fermentans]
MNRKEFVQLLGAGALSLAVAPNAFCAKRRKIDHSICQITWDNLCGNMAKVYKTDAFDYVSPIKKKPYVFIYGDSISIMYTSMVQQCLKGKANVYRLFKNGGSSRDFIPNMEKLHSTMFQPGLKNGWNFKWDIIHFNVGLHDLKYLKGRHLDKNGKQVSSLEEYKRNLNQICHYLKTQFPKAIIIFATTTSVPENSKGRFKGDSAKYNRAAKEVLVSYPDIIINDLYSFTLPHQKQWAQAPGNVHYNQAGFTAQGKEVARVISEYL